MKLGTEIINGFEAGARLLRTAIGRTIAGSASLVALAVFLWPRNDWQVEPDKLFAFVIALFTWLVSLFPERPPSSHDAQLFVKFQAVMTPAWITWLRRHDFGGSFKEDKLHPLFEIDGEWEGAAYSFDDPVLHGSFDALVTQICAFARLVAHNTWPIRGERWQTAVPGGEESFESAHVVERVKALNDGGTDLAKAIDAFITLARRRLDKAAVPAVASP